MSLRRSSDRAGSRASTSRLHAVLRAGSAENCTGELNRDMTFERGQRWFTDPADDIEEWKRDLYKLIKKVESSFEKAGYADLMHNIDSFLGITVLLTKGEFKIQSVLSSEVYQTKEILADALIEHIEKLGYNPMDTFFRFTQN